MSLYQHKCKDCDLEFEVLKPMSECNTPSLCPDCGQEAQRVFTPVPDIWGWELTESSHHKGAKDEILSDRPSNEPKLFREKAEISKTVW